MKSLLKGVVPFIPGPLLSRIVDWRFGGALIPRSEPWDTNGGELRVRLREVAFSVDPAWRDDLRFHFARNIDSRRELLAFARAASARAGTLFDVGAFRGLFSLVYCAARRDNRAVLFEPAPGVLEDARGALDRNGLLDRATLRAVAAGAEPAIASAAVDAVGFIDFRPTDGTRLAVPVVRLDDEMERLGMVPTVVKIDVEGAEFDVLRGAPRVLARRPTIFLELHLDALRQRGHDPAAVLSLLTDAGYTLFTHKSRQIPARRVVGSFKAVLRVMARGADPLD